MSSLEVRQDNDRPFADPYFNPFIAILPADAAAKAARFERPTLASIAMQQPPRARLDLSVLNAGEREQLVGLLRKVMSAHAAPAAISDQGGP